MGASLYKSLPPQVTGSRIFFRVGVESWVYPTISSYEEISQHLPNIYPTFLPQHSPSIYSTMTDSITQFLPLCLSNMIDSIPNFHLHIYPTHQKSNILCCLSNMLCCFIQHFMLLYPTFIQHLPSILCCFTQFLCNIPDILTQHLPNVS